MTERNLEIDLLLEQRNTLIADIKEFNSHIIKIVIALVPILATLGASYFPAVSKTDAFLIRYIILEIIFILSMVISACLIGANVKRDYIAAIDSYMFEMYGISVLICNGELSRKHTTGVKGAFPLVTLLIGLNVVSILVLLMFNVVKQDWVFYKEHVPLVLLLFIVSVVFYGWIGIINVKRKFSEKSVITEECLDYMKRDKNQKKGK